MAREAAQRPGTSSRQPRPAQRLRRAFSSRSRASSFFLRSFSACFALAASPPAPREPRRQTRTALPSIWTPLPPPAAPAASSCRLPSARLRRSRACPPRLQPWAPWIRRIEVHRLIARGERRWLGRRERVLRRGRRRGAGALPALASRSTAANGSSEGGGDRGADDRGADASSKPGSGTTSSESAGEPPRAGGGRKSITVFCGLLPPSRPEAPPRPATRASRDRGTMAVLPRRPVPPRDREAAPRRRSWASRRVSVPRLLGCRLRSGLTGQGTTGLPPGLAASASADGR